MPLSTDIKLPKDFKPIFPDRCVACGQDAPGSVVRVSTYSIGWWSWLLWLPGRRFTADVPACQTCRRKILKQRWQRWALTWAFAALGVAAAVYALGTFRKPFYRTLAMGIGLACMAPYFFWETFFPPPIGLTAHSDSVDYEFLDEAYADDFLELNQQALAGS